MHLVSNIDFYHGSVGGIILGISSTLLLLLTGQITGLSGIAEGLISRNGEDWHWSYLFGLCSSGYYLSLYHNDLFLDANDVPLLSMNTIIISGLLIGFGTRLGSGCTSGHGLCGLPRLSIRSLVAVLCFMTSGAISSFLSNLPSIHPLLLAKNNEIIKVEHRFLLLITVFIVLVSRNLDYIYTKQNVNKDIHKKSSSILIHITSLCCGFLFGIGLSISGMCNPLRVIRFLNFAGIDGWDPSLISVLGSGVFINLITFNLLKYTKQKVLLIDYTSTTSSVTAKPKDLGMILNIGLVSSNLDINWKLILGSILFGIGWGITGLCPGPAIVSFGSLTNDIAIKFIPSLFIGMLLKQLIVS